MFDAQKEKNRIVSWLEDYRDNKGCKGVVFGVSGGKDSTVVSMLSKKVWGDNALGILMPNGVQADIADSLEIVKAVGVNYRVVNIGEVYNSFVNVIENKTDGEVNIIGISEKSKTNIPPRIRMTVLYAVAQSLGYMVIGTGNRSEGYIGWTTKFGDNANDFNPIAHLTCTEVIALGHSLADEFGLDKKFVIKTPTDGLTGKSDEANFGFTYRQLDEYIKFKDEHPSGDGLPENFPQEVARKISAMHLSSEHKRNTPKKIEG